MPKVTVIIPAYNAMTYLPETLDSVLKQTFADFEVLIVNDGSTDHIIEWASEINDSRVKLISQTNQGVSAARNTAINYAQGEYVAFLDADDLWEPTKLEKQVRRLESQPEVGLVYAWTLLVDQQGKSTGTVTASHTEGNVWEKLLLGDVIGNGSSAMIRRSCFETVGLFDGKLSGVADCDMWIRVAANYPIAVIKEVLVYYRQHSISMSRNYDKMMQDSRLKIEKKFLNVPFELLYLRPRAYGHAFLWLAWKIMFDGADPKKASYFSHQAILHYPRMQYSARYLRLQFVLILVRLFGANSYIQLRNMRHKLRGGVFQYHQ